MTQDTQRAPWVLASRNPHKVREFGLLLEGAPLLGLGDFPAAPDVVEDAPDFVGNARLKAEAAWRHTGHISLADDSGLGVVALGGEPGVRSARWVAGSDADRVAALLARMAEVTDRRAYFVCALVVAGLPAAFRAAHPQGGERWAWRGDCAVASGRLEGTLAQAPVGQGGFGYDPIFRLADGRTVGQLSAPEKAQISHRALAAQAILPLMRAWRAF